MLGFIYHHKSFPDDLRADIEFTLKRCIRDGVAQDAHVVDQILSYKTSEAPASSPAATASSSALQDLNSKLDSFLSMFDTDDSEDSDGVSSSVEAAKSPEVVDLSAPFVCSLCHENNVSSPSDVPLLLCHEEMSFNTRRRRANAAL